MQAIVEVRTINRSLEDVYAYLVDTRHLDQWVPGAADLKPLADPAKPGDVVTFRVSGLTNSLTFNAIEPQRKIAYDVRNALVLLPVIIELEAIAADKTRLTKSQTVQPLGIGRLVGPLLERGIKQRVAVEADSIKHQLEA